MKRATYFFRAAAVLGAGMVLLEGCGLILGLGDYKDETHGSGGANGSSSSSAGMGGAPSECEAPGDCPDPGNECQARTCTNHQCGVTAVTAGTALSKQTPGDCKEVQCDGAGHVTTVPKDSDIQDDMKACTTDTCAAGNPLHTNKAPRTPCSEGTGTICDANGNCVECIDGTDCASTICETGVCVAASCTDGVKNNDESDVDCGGSCAPCPDGKDCGHGSDCAGGACNSGICCTPTTCTAVGLTCGQTPDGCGGMLQCDDGLADGTETDVDCGGASCQKCTQGQKCVANSDCTTTHCVDGVCCNSSCTTTCLSCDITGSIGTCTFTPPNQKDKPNCDSDSGGNLACNGAGVCLGGAGHDCTMASQCVTGVCSGLAQKTCGH